MSPLTAETRNAFTARADGVPLVALSCSTSRKCCRYSVMRIWAAAGSSWTAYAIGGEIANETVPNTARITVDTYILQQIVEHTHPLI